MIVVAESLTGRVVRRIGGVKGVPDDELKLYALSGEFAIEVDDDVVPAGECWVNGAEIHPVPAMPSPLRNWDWVTKCWVGDLAQVQAALMDALEAERARRNDLPIGFAGVLFDANTVAKQNLGGWLSVLAAGGSLPSGFTWRDASNAEHLADAAFLVGLGAAMAARGTELYRNKWSKQRHIESALTVAELDTFDMTEGWSA